MRAETLGGKHVETGFRLEAPPSPGEPEFGSGTSGKESACQVQETQETRVQFLGREDPVEEGVATHSQILAWRIPWKEEPGGLQSMESQSQTRLSH